MTHISFHVYQVNLKIILKVPGLLSWLVTAPSLWTLQGEITGSQDIRQQPQALTNRDAQPPSL